MQTALELNGLASSLALDLLSTHDLGVGGVGEQGGQELGLLGEGIAAVGAVDDVVAEDGRDQARVLLDGSGVGRVRSERCDGLVVGRQDGDVLGAPQGGHQRGLRRQQVVQRRDGLVLAEHLCQRLSRCASGEESGDGNSKFHLAGFSTVVGVRGRR